MATTTIRVSTQTRETLHQLAEASGVSMQKIIDNALEVYKREQLMEQANVAYALLREDPAAWGEIERERQEWDATLGDGLENQEEL
jgi:predicted transcriptional regulator